MAKRFRTLNAALRYLQPVGTDGDGVTPDAPQNSQLKEYQEWKAGKRNVNYIRAETSNPERLLKVSLQPFAIPAADTDRVIVKFSQRASTNGFGASGLLAADLGHASPADKDAGTTRGFIPARAIVSRYSGEGASVKSKLTGRDYKKKAGSATYTFPFGQVGATDSLKERQKAILTKVAADPAISRTVSYTPERYS